MPGTQVRTEAEPSSPATRTVWSKQHVNVLKLLNENGRYTAKRGYIVGDLQDHAAFILEAYDWYVQKVSAKYPRPAGVSYPVWVSLSLENAMIPSENTVILEMEIDERAIMPININKWSAILNYSYIARDRDDERRHRLLLERYGTSDAQAYMTSFYPQIKKEIVLSWDRLFDDSIAINDNRMAYGTVWELRREWITNVTKY